MKKIIYVLIFLLFFIPFNAKAYGIENYRIDITVLENGDIKVLEAFEMNNEYNGFERIINYKNSFDSYYGSTLSSTGDANIYNGNNVMLEEIRGINFNKSAPFIYFQTNGDLFNKVPSASKGEYGIYVINKREIGETYVIYNHSNRNKDFYLEYTLQNMAIVHNDIAELGFNIFTQMNESIKNLEITINVPSNKNLLKIWAHGPLNGVSEIVDEKTVKMKATDLNENVALDFRLVFDKEVINLSKKTTNITALNKIIEIETALADEANKKRDEAYKLLQDEAYKAVELVKKSKKQTNFDKALISVSNLKEDDNLKKELTITLDNLKDAVKQRELERSIIYTCLFSLWMIGLTILIIYIYIKYDKENKTKFKNKYLREFPNDYHPATVGYLIRKKITKDDLSASILSLINQKIINYEKLEKDDFKFTKNNNASISEVDEKLIEFLFSKEESITLSELKKNASKNYDKFIANYSNWYNKSLIDAEKENFYESLLVPKIIVILYGIFGFVMLFLFLDKTFYISIPLIIFMSLGAIIYGLAFTKRTLKGNEDRAKWLALKKFMIDFGNMEDKELPEIILWEKYLVYAITLGCADKLAKVMKIKVEQLNIDNNMMDFRDVIIFNSIMNNSITSVINTAYQTRSIEMGSNSSGGGFGGGFSGGGGSFGGGGGGGRF